MRRWISIVAILALVLSLAFPVVAPAASPTPKPHAAPRTPTPERHPQIHQAIESLRNAPEHLEHASHDFGGRREEAMRVIDEAIRQLQIRMQYDKD